jgi:hypothetical protein
MVNNLMDNRIHPVFIFGTTASGKTTALQSLIYYARQQGMAIVSEARFSHMTILKLGRETKTQKTFSTMG